MPVRLNKLGDNLLFFRGVVGEVLQPANLQFGLPGNQLPGRLPNFLSLFLCYLIWGESPEGVLTRLP